MKEGSRRKQNQGDDGNERNAENAPRGFLTKQKENGGCAPCQLHGWTTQSLNHAHPAWQLMQPYTHVVTTPRTIASCAAQKRLFDEKRIKMFEPFYVRRVQQSFCLCVGGLCVETSGLRWGGWAVPR